MKLLILGGSGRLGKELVKVCSQDHDVLAPRGLNITEHRMLDRYITDHKPECIINCAAMPNVDRCELEPKRCYDVNTWGVANLVEWCNLNHARLIQISSNYVFGDGVYTDAEPRDSWEDDIRPPVNVYGWSKYMAEWWIRKYMISSYLIIRTANLFGGFGKTKTFAEKVLDKAGRYEKISVGHIHTNPTYVPHLAGVIMDMVGDTTSRTWHVVNYGKCTYYEFAFKILDTYGYSSNIGTEYTGGYAARPSVHLHPSVVLPTWEDAVEEWWNSYVQSTN